MKSNRYLVKASAFFAAFVLAQSLGFAQTPRAAGNQHSKSGRTSSAERQSTPSRQRTADESVLSRTERFSHKVLGLASSPQHVARQHRSPETHAAEIELICHHLNVCEKFADLLTRSKDQLAPLASDTP